jgi:cytochrome c6
VTKGKNAMPAFKGRLNPQQIEEVANYVLEKADKGWS